MTHKKYDYIVIWAGSGGLTMAISLASAHKDVLLIEWKHFGWDCTNTGCVPSKALIDFAHKNPQAISQAMEHVRTVRQWFLDHENSDYFSSRYNLDSVLGFAHFVNKNTVCVNEQYYSFDRCVIATWSRPLIPDIPWLEAIWYYTSDNFFEIQGNLSQLTIIGWGYIACELANACAKLGVLVTILQRNEDLIPHEDRDARLIMKEQLEKLWVKIHCSVADMRIQNNKLLFTSQGQIYEWDSDAILIAAGRTVDLSKLELENAQLKYDKNWIIVNDTNRTSNNKIFAIGDCVSGNPKFTHRADHEALNLFKRFLIPLFWPKQYRDDSLPSTIYTDYEISQVWYTSDQLNALFHVNDYKTIKKGFSENDKAIIQWETQGYISIHFSRLSWKILGATIVCKWSSEMIGLLTYAINNGVSAYSLANQIFQYPVKSHLIKKICQEFVVKTLRNIWWELQWWLRTHAFKIAAILFWSLLLWLFFIYQHNTGSSFAQLGSDMLGFFATNMRGPALFMSFYAFRTLILFPAGITTIMGGILFGPVWWCVYVYLGENISASIARAVWKYLGNSSLPGKTKGLMNSIKKYLKGNDFISTLMLRLIPVNFDMVNYACGIFGVKRKPYALATAFGIIPGMVTYVLVGATFHWVRSFDFSNIKLNNHYLLISWALYLISFALAFLVKKQMKDEE